MTTYRRELISKFKVILLKWYGDNPRQPDEEGYAESVASELADAVIESRKPKVDFSQSDPAWAILAGVEIKAEQIDRNRLEKDALEAFERDMGCPKNWQWYASNDREDAVWKQLRDFVVEQYSKNVLCFQEYQTWRTQPFARGAMSNLAIRKNPENFQSSWSDFLASNAMYGKKDKQEVKTDENDIPMSY